MASYSPRNKMYLSEINKPQARISGVELSMCYPVDSNTCIEVTT
jgi:outer membrane receptor for ferrienterochelin and colicin